MTSSRASADSACELLTRDTSGSIQKKVEKRAITRMQSPETPEISRAYQEIGMAPPTLEQMPEDTEAVLRTTTRSIYVAAASMEAVTATAALNEAHCTVWRSENRNLQIALQELALARNDCAGAPPRTPPFWHGRMISQQSLRPLTHAAPRIPGDATELDCIFASHRPPRAHPPVLEDLRDPQKPRTLRKKHLSHTHPCIHWSAWGATFELRPHNSHDETPFRTRRTVGPRWRDKYHQRIPLQTSTEHPAVESPTKTTQDIQPDASLGPRREHAVSIATPLRPTILLIATARDADPQLKFDLQSTQIIDMRTWRAAPTRANPRAPPLFVESELTCHPAREGILLSHSITAFFEKNSDRPFFDMALLQ